MSTPTIVAAAAAAILHADRVPGEIPEEAEDLRFYVHPHVAVVREEGGALQTYIESIYSGDEKLPTDVTSPKSDAFKKLRSKDSVAEATRQAALDLCNEMQSVRAKEGILFGFVLRLQGNRLAHGLIKADLEEEQRFHIDLAAQDEWSIEAVEDMLPPPTDKYAKYIIAPRPRVEGAAGIRDRHETDAAAQYFLRAVGVTVPRRRHTQRDVARAAKRAGYGHDEVRRELGKVDRDRPVDEVIDESFPNIDDRTRRSLKGSDELPLETVLAEDDFVTVLSTSTPTFQLRFDRSVKVEVEGRQIVVTLPEDADALDTRYE